MTLTVPKKLASLVGLEGVLLVAIFVYVAVAINPESVPGSVRFLPYGVFAAGLLVSWRYHRSLLLFGFVVLAFADRGFFPFHQ